jgi:hypothetical protein
MRFEWLTDGPGWWRIDEGRDIPPEACSAAVYAARGYLLDHGRATKQEILAEVMPEHRLGYDVDGAMGRVESGERYRGS